VKLLDKVHPGELESLSTGKYAICGGRGAGMSTSLAVLVDRRAQFLSLRSKYGR
jgi:hypothetical protein